MIRHIDTPDERAVLTATEARSAERSGRVLRVLTVSLVLAVTVMAVVYLLFFA